ncbi:MAG: KpsF/GutQ family sugar-phosphate isomerase [Succinivibrio dextrinosolvens]|uniref:Arabinose 5-phosphate isomerase n=1 Tax=Succinivibrio dextrinosolvens TaxID=83771 RepID=A0A662Z9A0_9GAMM|nr:MULTISPECIES: KpsF/GutQ family sugar-phosphate isomerase [Succinivibrio]MBQ9219925.1 KpsF/GutQ family sugar-phosphate isomerase [Succinivibrio sp.]MDY6466237.1 KpsF/GutQ family sugar-phosphate isomerase [Succinivibrio dextrinosolvens]MDY6470687.1 KpsF/GutQ family sugar-phosphate isomerase [Succinivibrio dextrinosolvens]SFJ97288.1 arabinose-5-phosphate isomerase [Succinivibrio dextrinosolvens]
MSSQACIKAGVRVLKEEAQAIIDLIPSINENFVKACEIILNTKGKVILTGVGKSGHIATKIASTFASTGTQSFFVQAGEAAHGDLGMIGKDDCVIAISNSGEGSELKILIPILKRRCIPLIAIVGDTESSLGKAANVTLSAHVEKEACPLNLAPTSSSTAELALGDALAVALIESRGFTERDFAMSHPGGALGRRLLVHCQDIMHKGNEIPVVKSTVSLKDALFEMTQKTLGFICIVNDKHELVGVYTDGDLRRSLEKGATIEANIADLMSKTVRGIVSSDTLAADALAMMHKLKINSMIVTDENNHPIGAFNLHDLMQAGII